VAAVQLERRAEIHAALGDPVRLAIVDELATSDRSPSELSAALGLRPPLLAFHLDTLARAGLITRIESSGDRRRKYVQLVAGALDEIGGRPSLPTGPVLFVCTHNSARSQLAAALWRHAIGTDARSAGTEPAERVHPGAVAAARRAGLDLGDAIPRRFDPTATPADIVTVCDRAHEDLGLPARHWSIPDPVADGSDAAFDNALGLIRARIATLVTTPPEAP
jgi:ArsR family transcriptional regulator, arsenate/arsenite/antimonite-responsive transcriptional repressor / arsenate reductase (thioredoxin)